MLWRARLKYVHAQAAGRSVNQYILGMRPAATETCSPAASVTAGMGASGKKRPAGTAGKGNGSARSKHSRNKDIETTQPATETEMPCLITREKDIRTTQPGTGEPN